MHASRTDPSLRGRISGERVSNTYVTYPNVGDNSPKGGLIPHVVAGENPVDKRADLSARFRRGVRPISLLVG